MKLKCVLDFLGYIGSEQFKIERGMEMFFPDPDPRIARWPYMEGGTSSFLIVLSYLLFVKVIGPAYMRGRRPYDLRTAMICYNLAMVAYSAWMFYEFGVHGWFGKYSYSCEPVTFSGDEDAMGMVTVCWHFVISKIVELLDTVFFVLRKKDANVTYLHIVHHTLTLLVARYVISHGAAGYNTLFAFVNTFVHTWMYLYYGIAALGPSVQKYLWWKKYLTKLQMVQFVFVLVVLLNQALNPGCQTNRVLISMLVGLAVLFLVLFSNFYRNSYGKEQRSRSAYGGPARRAIDADADAAQANGNATGTRLGGEQSQTQGRKSSDLSVEKNGLKI